MKISKPIKRYKTWEMMRVDTGKESEMKRLLIVITILAFTYFCKSACYAEDDKKWKSNMTAGQNASEEGNLMKAVKFYSSALNEAEKSFGPDDPRLVTNLTTLAEMLEENNKYADAVLLYKRALNIQEKKAASFTNTLAATYESVALLYTVLGKNAESEAAYKKAITINERLHGPNHPAVAKDLLDLASLYSMEGRHDEEIVLYKQSLAILEKTSGSEHTNLLLNNLESLALAYANQQKYAEAIEFYERSVAITKKTFGANNPSEGFVYERLAKIYLAENELVKAEQFFKQALEIAEYRLNRKQEHDYDLNHIRQEKVASALGNLADFYTKCGNHARAESLYKRTLSIIKELYAISYPLSVARVENRLADCYESQGKHSEAEPLYKHAITVEESKCPHDNLDLAAMLHSYASLLRKINRGPEAATVEARANIAAQPGTK